MSVFNQELANAHRMRSAGFNRVILSVANVRDAALINSAEPSLWLSRLNEVPDLHDFVNVSLDPSQRYMLIDTIHKQTDRARALARAVIGLDETLLDHPSTTPLGIQGARISSNVFDIEPHDAWLTMGTDPNSDYSQQARDISARYMETLVAHTAERLVEGASSLK